MTADAPILRCPRDGGILAEAGESGVARRCPTCGGVFAVSGELLLAIRNASMSGAINPGIRPIPPVCPSCRAIMEDRLISGMEIDVCDACRSVWLDHGELEKVNAYLARDPAIDLGAQGVSLVLGRLVRLIVTGGR